MDLDVYQPCPCGDGKKIKFCCCKDITAELDRVLRAVEGEQRVAALDQINHLIAAKGERAALLALKVTTEMQLGELDAAAATVDKFLAQQPNNPVALAQWALLAASDHNAGEAVLKLQKALEVVGDSIPMAVYEAIGVVGQSLLSEGHLPAARGHLLLQATMGGGEDTRPISMLLRLYASPQVPLLMKQDSTLEEPPAGAAWAGEFEAAMQLAGRGAWLASVEKLTALAQRVPDEPALWKNIAVMRGFLGDTHAAVNAWRKFASLPNVPLEDAAEAEALAQMLDPDTYQDTIDELTITYPIHDAEKLMERLLSDRRTVQMPVDPRQLATEDQPAPKGVFWLLDRALPATVKDLAPDDVPNVIGEMYLFGKQTDRGARLEFVVSQSDDFESKTNKLTEFLGDLAGPQEQQEVTEQMAAVPAAMTWNWRLPDDVSREQRADLISQQRREVILNKWPTLSLRVLDGKRPADVASDPAYRVRLLAAVLLLELSGEQSGSDVDYNELRRKLNLPACDAIDSADLDVIALPLVRLSRLVPEKLSDETLIDAYQRAARMHATVALWRLASEVIRRESLDGKVDKAEAHELLSHVARNPDDALGLIVKAREIAAKQGQSPARYLLAELGLRLSRNDVAEAQRLIQLIQSKHIREPGVAQGLYQMLVQFGIIAPDGTPAGPQPRSAPPAAAAAAQPAPQTGGLWTPDSPAPQPTGETKSKLWLPGMD
jgi:tetratricopeptide (TPR) repeat protein